MSQALSMFFFQVNSLCMIFFGYMIFAGFFLNITLELFCVFRNTEYVSKYAHFSSYCFINYCEFKIIVLKSFSNHVLLEFYCSVLIDFTVDK